MKWENVGMTIVRRESLAEQAAALLLARIVAGEWEVGGKLPGETTLAPQLGVGRSTAREAIRLLAGRGVLATRQGSGVFVTATDAPGTWDDVVRRADIVAVLEARTAIEVEAASLAARRRTATDLDRLGQTLAARDRGRADVVTHVETDRAFHRAIVAAAHNPVLLDLFDGFAPRWIPAMTDMLQLRGHHGDAADHDVHARIRDAIAKGEADSAAALTRAHLDAVAGLLG